MLIAARNVEFNKIHKMNKYLVPIYIKLCDLKALTVSTFHRDGVISVTKHSAMFFMVMAITVKSFLSFSFHLEFIAFMHGFKSHAVLNVYLTRFNLIKAAAVINQAHYRRQKRSPS